MTLVAEARRVGMRFGRGADAVHALIDVDLAIGAGEIVGVVGEFGSGKSTLGRSLLRLLQPTAGSVHFSGHNITAWPERRLRPLRARMTLVFQDPWSALNPRMTARALIAEPLKLHVTRDRARIRAATDDLARRVHIAPTQLDRYPSGLSGGQLQRVCLARAIAADPELIVLDEPTSSLDMSVRAGMLELLAELRAATGAAMLFITHDLATLRVIADRIVVLYLGRKIEEGSKTAVPRPSRASLHPSAALGASSRRSGDPLPTDPAHR